MDADERAQKLATIAKLPADQLPGWWRYCTAYRQPFSGELAALMARAKALGIVLPSSDAAQSASTTTTPRAQPHT